MGKRKGYNLISGAAKACLPKSKGEEGRELCIQMDGTQAPELSSLFWRYKKCFQLYFAVVKNRTKQKKPQTPTQTKPLSWTEN